VRRSFLRNNADGLTSIEQRSVPDNISSPNSTKSQHTLEAHAPASATQDQHHDKTQRLSRDSSDVKSNRGEEGEADFESHDFLNVVSKEEKAGIFAFAKYHQHLSWIQKEPLICFYRTMKDLQPLEHKPSENIDQERQFCESWLAGELPAMIESFLDYSRNIKSNVAITYRAYYGQLLKNREVSIEAGSKLGYKDHSKNFSF
jgi:hypothetical protein